MTAEKAKTAYETLISSLDKLLPNKFGLQLLIVQLAESYAKQQLKERDDEIKRMISDSQKALFVLCEREIIQTYPGVKKQNERAQDILRNSLQKVPNKGT